MRAEPGAWLDRAGDDLSGVFAHRPLAYHPGPHPAPGVERPPLTRDEVGTFLAAFFALRARAGHPALPLHPEAGAMLAERSGGARHRLRRLVEHAVFVARLDGSESITPAHVEAAWLTYQKIANAEDPPTGASGEAGLDEAGLGEAGLGEAGLGGAGLDIGAAQDAGAVVAAAAPALRRDAPLRAAASQRLPSPSAFTLAGGGGWRALRLGLAGTASGMAALAAGACIGLAVQPPHRLPPVQSVEMAPGPSALAAAPPDSVAAISMPVSGPVSGPVLTPVVAPILAPVFGPSAAGPSAPLLAGEPSGPMADVSAMPSLLRAVAPAPVPAAAARTAGGDTPADVHPGAAPPVSAPPVSAPPVSAPPVDIRPVDTRAVAAPPADTRADLSPAAPALSPAAPALSPAATALSPAALADAQVAQYDMAEPHMAKPRLREARMTYFFGDGAASLARRLAGRFARGLGSQARLTALACGTTSRPGIIRIDLSRRGPVDIPPRDADERARA